MKPQVIGASLRQTWLRLFVGRAQERETFKQAINADVLLLLVANNFVLCQAVRNHPDKEAGCESGWRAESG
jgi:hypothetical protein